MFKMFDFNCSACGVRFEALLGRDEKATCKCGSSDVQLVPNAARKFEVIAVLKKNKAGHIHKFQNRPREKMGVQVSAKIGS